MDIQLYTPIFDLDYMADLSYYHYSENHERLQRNPYLNQYDSLFLGLEGDIDAFMDASRIHYNMLDANLLSLLNFTKMDYIRHFNVDDFQEAEEMQEQQTAEYLAKDKQYVRHEFIKAFELALIILEIQTTYCGIHMLLEELESRLPKEEEEACEE